MAGDNREGLRAVLTIFGSCVLLSALHPMRKSRFVVSRGSSVHFPLRDASGVATRKGPLPMSLRSLCVSRTSIRVRTTCPSRCSTHLVIHPTEVFQAGWDVHTRCNTYCRPCHTQHGPTRFLPSLSRVTLVPISSSGLLARPNRTSY